MRIKFLSFIGCCLTLTALVSSCMGSGVDYEYSSDATIRSFGIDTVRGVTYPFTIDRIDGLIYNADSLPFETSLEKVVVTSFTHYGYYVKHTEADTLFCFPDSMDFSSYTREEPLQLTVYSTDEQHTKRL
ncbi:MAG: DUF6242 domain-containing protein [Bacteroides sp.]|nr:DUF6242 domain-containing protein [Bacteroides sp.]